MTRGGSISLASSLAATGSLITDLHDRAMLLQTFLTFDPTDDTRLQFGVLVPVADQGTEFSKRSAGMDQTLGGGWSIFLNLSYYL